MVTTDSRGLETHYISSRTLEKNNNKKTKEDIVIHTESVQRCPSHHNISNKLLLTIQPLAGRCNEIGPLPHIQCINTGHNQPHTHSRAWHKLVDGVEICRPPFKVSAWVHAVNDDALL